MSLYASDSRPFRGLCWARVSPCLRPLHSLHGPSVPSGREPGRASGVSLSASLSVPLLALGSLHSPSAPIRERRGTLRPAPYAHRFSARCPRPSPRGGTGPVSPHYAPSVLATLIPPSAPRRSPLRGVDRETPGGPFGPFTRPTRGLPLRSVPFPRLRLPTPLVTPLVPRFLHSFPRCLVAPPNHLHPRSCLTPLSTLRPAPLPSPYTPPFTPPSFSLRSRTAGGGPGSWSLPTVVPLTGACGAYHHHRGPSAASPEPGPLTASIVRLFLCHPLTCREAVNDMSRRMRWILSVKRYEKRYKNPPHSSSFICL